MTINHKPENTSKTNAAHPSLGKARNPNTGPYIVTYIKNNGDALDIECHTWKYACSLMREIMIEGYTVSVKFA